MAGPEDAEAVVAVPGDEGVSEVLPEDVEAVGESADVVADRGIAIAIPMPIPALVGTRTDVARAHPGDLGYVIQAYFHLLLMHYMPKKPILLQCEP